MIQFILFCTIIVVVECFELLVIPLETDSFHIQLLEIILLCCAFKNQVNQLELLNCVTGV